MSDNILLTINSREGDIRKAIAERLHEKDSQIIFDFIDRLHNQWAAYEEEIETLKTDTDKDHAEWQAFVKKQGLVQAFKNFRNSYG